VISTFRGLLPRAASPPIRTDRRFQPDGRLAYFLAFGAFAALLFASKLWLIGAYGNATPFWDQWSGEAFFLYQPYLKGTIRWADLFAPHNEHRIFMTRLADLALLNVNGIWNPLLEMVVNAVLHIITLGLGITLLARVVGRDYLPFLLLFSLILFAVPYAWENTLMGFETGFYLVLLFTFASLWLTVTENPLSARWWAGVVCAILAFLSLASGACAPAAGAILGLLFYSLGLRRTRRQLAAVAILAGLWALGVALTPSVPEHASLKAASPLQFFHAWAAILGWPISPDVFAALIVNLPAILFVATMLRNRPAVTDRRWYLFALIVWILGQTAGIAYGRAAYFHASRYFDFFAIGILVNFSCLISLAQGHIGKRFGWTIPSAAAWTVAILACLAVYAGRHVPEELAVRRDTSLAQETNTKAFLATGDIKHLQGKPPFHVPYPDSQWFATILQSSEILAVLPANIRADSRTGRLDGAISVLLASYHVFLILGLAAAMSLLLQWGLTKRPAAFEDEPRNATTHVPAREAA
jgi:hypothetical protein